MTTETEYIRNESVRLMVISRNDISQHIAISGKIGTAWNADVLGAVVEDKDINETKEYK
ncbi:hypothetical protein EOD39_14943 [Acipenser ruthenus]|uniref:Uncharacterized protein n=1 Tax=Acipenser ruthenus TaxID=7906 RepID=A0A662YJW0_ACIRT|nr:hypothetical protein EOD39_14943 [Acipenser ruthenus]